MSTKKIFLVLLPVLILYVSAIADSFTLGGGTLDAEDTYIKENDATTNYGSDNVIYIKDSDAQEYRALIKYPDMRDSLYGRIVDSAFQYIDYSATNATDMGHEMHGLRRDFVENEATWNVYSNGNNWGTAGAYNTTTDIYADVLDSLVGPGDTTSAGEYRFEVTDYLRLCDNKDTANYFGVIWIPTIGTEDGAIIGGYASESGTETNRSYVTVYYHDAPEGGGQVMRTVIR